MSTTWKELVLASSIQQITPRKTSERKRNVLTQNLGTDNSMKRANSKMKKTCKQSVHLPLSTPIKLTHILKSSSLMTMTWLPPINAVILLASVQSTISSILPGQQANKNNTTYCKKWPYPQNKMHCSNIHGSENEITQYQSFPKSALQWALDLNLFASFSFHTACNNMNK